MVLSRPLSTALLEAEFFFIKSHSFGAQNVDQEVG